MWPFAIEFRTFTSDFSQILLGCFAGALVCALLRKFLIRAQVIRIISVWVFITTIDHEAHQLDISEDVKDLINRINRGS